MIDNKKILAIIPARGGSKGIPRKNTKLLNGKPLIAYTIEESKKSKYIDEILVSTEDNEIADISIKYGVEIPFLRPMELAKDSTPGIEPIIHAIGWLKEENKKFDYVLCIQCTSPLRTAEQIDEAIEKLVHEGADSIVSICESEVNPYWMKKVDDGKLKDFMESTNFYARRQDLPTIYRLNGAIYAGKTEIILKNKNWYTENTLPYIMNELSSIDIDNIIDFKFVEFLLKEKNNAK